MTRPEQSKADGPVAPRRHGSPSWFFAIWMICWASVRGSDAAAGVAGASPRSRIPAKTTGMNARAPRSGECMQFLSASTSSGDDGDRTEPRAWTRRVSGKDEDHRSGTGQSTTDAGRAHRGARPAAVRVALLLGPSDRPAGP